MEVAAWGSTYRISQYKRVHLRSAVLIRIVDRYLTAPSTSRPSLQKLDVVSERFETTKAEFEVVGENKRGGRDYPQVPKPKR